MGACSGKSSESEKRYAGYSNSPQTSRNRAGSVSTKQPDVVPTPKTENKHGFNLDENKLHDLQSHDMRVLVKLMNHDNLEISQTAYDIISGISIIEFTGTISVTPNAVKSLSKLLDVTKCDVILVECLTAMHTLVQQDEDLTVEIYIACIDKLIVLLKRDASDLLSCVISLLGLLTAVDDILCDMIDKGVHELLADTFHATSDIVVKRQIFLTLHNFMTIKNSERAMHMKVIQILVETLQTDDKVIDPAIRISALRILSYAAMSGSESMQKMIGELGGINVLLKFVRGFASSSSSSSISLVKPSVQEPTQIAGMALSGLCCVEGFQEGILREWGIENMLEFVESNAAETSVVLAVVMAINGLLGNDKINTELRAHPTLKRQLVIIQQQTENEDIQDECIESLSKLMLAITPHSKFEKLCMQHFSPSASLMRQKGNRAESARRRSLMTQNWLLSPDRHHSSTPPRRTLFPRRLNLFSPSKAPSSPLCIPPPSSSSSSHQSSFQDSYSSSSPALNSSNPITRHKTRSKKTHSFSPYKSPPRKNNTSPFHSLHSCSPFDSPHVTT